MADEIIKRDQNSVTVGAGITDDSNAFITMFRIDPVTKRLLISAVIAGVPTGSGTANQMAYWTDANTLSSFTNGTAGWVLTSNGAGSPPSFQAPAGGGGTPGGSDTQFQYNNGGAFGGVANLTFNNSTGAITFAGSSDTAQLTIKAHSSQASSNPLMLFQDSGGTELGRINFPGGENISIGYQAGIARTTGVSNIYIGYEAGLSSTSANTNIGIGLLALRAATTGGSGNNIAIGAYAGAKINGSSECIAIGSASMYNTVGGADFSTFVGASSGQGGVITAAGNTGIGYSAGYDLTSGANNVLLGRGSHGVTTGSTNIVIGYNNDPVSNTASDQLQIGAGLMGANINTLATSVFGLGIVPSTSTTLLLRGSTTAISSLRITSGTAPTSPVSGDMWQDGTHLYAYIDGATRQIDQQGGGSGATTALDNLASVAINTSLISDTNNTDDLGSTGIRWKKTWTVDLESTNAPTIGGTAATGSGGLVRATSPTIATSILTSSTSFTAWAGATTLLTIGGTGASASLFAPSTLDTSSSTTGAIRTSGGISAAKALYIGTTATVTTSVSTPQVFNAENAQTASSNAITFTRDNKINKVTNNSAAGLTITLSTTGATAGDTLIIKSVPSSAVAQTITWVNTEVSDVTPSANLNASTTSPRTDAFMWNSLTSKWRCVASC